MNVKPGAVALDLDNTMYEYEPCHSAAMAVVAGEIMNRLGIPKSNWIGAYEESRGDSKSRLGQTAASHSRLIYFKGMLEKLGLASQVDLALQLESLYWGEFIRNIQRADALVLFLELCRENAIPVVVVTDLTTGIQIRKLHKLKVIDLISGLVTSEDVGADKPASAHLNYIKNSIGIDASHWWVVGDDQLKDGGFAETTDGGVFIHISAEGKSSMDFRKLANILETLCQ